MISRRTPRPAIGRSATRRRYRLWMRSDLVPQTGQILSPPAARTTITAIASSRVALSITKPPGTNFDGRNTCPITSPPPQQQEQNPGQRGQPPSNVSQSPVWTPITPQEGALFHAD